MPLILFEPMSFGKGMLMMFLILLAFGVVGAVVVYYALKIFAQFVNQRRDVWAETAQTLGLEMQMEYHRLVKPLKGVYQNFQVEILHESPDGEHSYTTCRVWLPTALPFSLEIGTQGYLKRVADAVLGTTEIQVGVDGFDKSFSVNGSDSQAIQQLLSVYMPDGKAPNLTVDLLALRKSGYLIKVTDEQVQMQKRGEFLEPDKIEPILDAAIRLVKRIQTAREKSEVV